MIDEKRLIKSIKNYTEEVYGCDATDGSNVIEFQSDKHNEKVIQDFIQGFCESVEIINSQPRINKWIPCSERFPTSEECEKDDGSFMCFTEYGVRQVYGYSENLYKLDEYDFARKKNVDCKNGFYDYDSEYGYLEVDIIAWQPLPEKYKGE